MKTLKRGFLLLASMTNTFGEVICRLGFKGVIGIVMVLSIFLVFLYMYKFIFITSLVNPFLGLLGFIVNTYFLAVFVSSFNKD